MAQAGGGRSIGRFLGSSQDAPLRTVVSDGTTRVFTVELAPDEELATHRAPGPLTLLVVAGSVEFIIDSETTQCSVGDCRLVASGVEHAIRGLGPDRNVVVGVLQVARAEPRASAPILVDLAEQWGATTDRGVIWTLPQGAGINCNLVRLNEHDAIDRHINDAVDVVVVGLSGSAQLVVDGAVSALGANQLALVPKGSSRQLKAGRETFSYLSIHAERSGLTIDPTRRRTEEI